MDYEISSTAVSNNNKKTKTKTFVDSQMLSIPTTSVKFPNMKR